MVLLDFLSKGSIWSWHSWVTFTYIRIVCMTYISMISEDCRDHRPSADLGDEWTLGGCLPVLLPVLGKMWALLTQFECLTAEQQDACCPCLITYCANLVPDSKTDGDDYTWWHNQHEGVEVFFFGGLHLFSFNSICVRQIIHTKMVSVQYSFCFAYVKPKQDFSFETWQVKCWAPELCVWNAVPYFSTLPRCHYI